MWLPSVAHSPIRPSILNTACEASHGPRLSPSADEIGRGEPVETPLAAGDERRRPVTLRSVDTQRSPKPARSAAPTWFDTLLQRSSQVLLIGALLVLGYWFVNVPLRNWLHNRRAPVARALSVRPSADSYARCPHDTTTSLYRTAAPAVGQISCRRTTAGFSCRAHRPSRSPPAQQRRQQRRAPRN